MGWYLMTAKVWLDDDSYEELDESKHDLIEAIAVNAKHTGGATIKDINLKEW